MVTRIGAHPIIDLLHKLGELLGAEARCARLKGFIDADYFDVDDIEFRRNDYLTARRDLVRRWQELADTLTAALPDGADLPGGFRVEELPSGQRVLAHGVTLYTGDRTWRRTHRTKYIAAQPGQWPKFGAQAPELIAILY
jgi:hypothetical protein